MKKEKKAISPLSGGIFLIAALIVASLFMSCKKDKEEKPDWKVVNAQDFEYNMTYMSQISFDGKTSRNVLTEIAALVNGECRGKANLVYESGLDIYLFHLTIYSNTASGEDIVFHVFNPDKKKIYKNCGTLTFRSNASEGGADTVLNCTK